MESHGIVKKVKVRVAIDVATKQSSDEEQTKQFNHCMYYQITKLGNLVLLLGHLLLLRLWIEVNFHGMFQLMSTVISGYTMAQAGWTYIFGFLCGFFHSTNVLTCDIWAQPWIHILPQQQHLVWSCIRFIFLEKNTRAWEVDQIHSALIF